MVFNFTDVGRMSMIWPSQPGDDRVSTVSAVRHSAYRRFGSMAASDVQSLAGEISKLIGADHVCTGETARQRYPGDQSWLTAIHAHHGKPLNQPDIVAAPGTTAEVAGIVAAAARMRIPITPLGGASGVQGAANANCGGLQLDLTRLDRVREIDTTSMTCTVEAGKNVSVFEKELNERGLSFTHYPASAEWATVGGSVAARGSGVLSTRYGNIQDHVLSLEVVLPDGGVVDLPSVPRHGVGPEMTQLFVGSEGTLGVVTAVRVKLRKLPVSRRFSVFRFPGLAEGIEAGRVIMTSGLRPAVMRLYDTAAATKSLERAVQAGLDGETMVLMVDGDHERLVEIEGTLCDEICIAHGGRPLSADIGRTWWERRYAFYHPPHAPELPQIWCTMDAVSDFTRIQALYDEVTRGIRESIEPRWGLTLKTHLSHWFEWGAMIYPRFIVPRGPDDLDEALALHDRIITAAVEGALRAGGVINDHHGVGMRLAPHLEAQFGAAGMKLMRGIKNGIDPDHLFCPGKLSMG
jgi:alkyldihydroxyacetonephosphate synthase